VGVVGVGADAVGFAEVRQGADGGSRAVFQRSGGIAPKMCYVTCEFNGEGLGMPTAQFGLFGRSERIQEGLN